MTFSRYNKGRPFLVAKFIRMVPKGAATHTTDYGKTGQWNIGESITIEDSIKDRHLIESTVIIDILKAKIIKNRLPESDEEVLSYFVKKYNKDIQRGIQIWMRKHGMSISEKQIKRIEDNIDKPDIIASTLAEGDQPDEKVVEKPKRKPRAKKVAEPKKTKIEKATTA